MKFVFQKKLIMKKFIAVFILLITLSAHAQQAANIPKITTVLLFSYNSVRYIVKNLKTDKEISKMFNEPKRLKIC